MGITFNLYIVIVTYILIILLSSRHIVEEFIASFNPFIPLLLIFYSIFILCQTLEFTSQRAFATRNSTGKIAEKALRFRSYFLPFLSAGKGPELEIWGSL